MLESEAREAHPLPGEPARGDSTHGRSVKASGVRPRRCAVYTRKSSDEGLEQSFNSLDAQREACEAYIASQKHEGWRLVETGYDDGGLSGGTMNRPALQRLLTDIKQGLVDVVVVYKVDRLTRSLADFAKLTDLLDAAGTSFVSVTQAFNTSTSMGRLTLNVLLSFAQFEREVAGERIRDKIAASKKRGMWMGGMPPLGYDVRDKQLIVNEAEARTVRTIFATYVKLGTVARIKAALDAEGIVSKMRTIKGTSVGGGPISRNGYHSILKCPLYRGMIHHKGQLYDGNHDAIIDQVMWERVQAQLVNNSANRRLPAATGTQSGRCNPLDTGRRSISLCEATPSHLLKGILFDGSGGRLSSTYSIKQIKGGGRRRYDYYASACLLRGASRSHASKTQLRVAAPELDALIIAALKEHLGQDEWILSLAQDPLSEDPLGENRLTVNQQQRLIADAHALSASLSPSDARALLERVVVGTDQVTLSINSAALASRLGVKEDPLPSESISIGLPCAIDRRRRSTKLLLGSVDVQQPCIDTGLVEQLRQAHRWWQALVGGGVSSIAALASQERVDASEISRTITLAFLDPSIVRMILQGTQPPTLTIDALRRARPVPPDWSEQRQLLLN
jgi:site-specific DNA recombinase